jgi:hypothetical protein
MDARIAAKPAPLRIVHFLSELLRDLSSPCKVLSVEVEAAMYRVTLALPDHGRAIIRLSAFDVSRSVRGDQDALASLGSDLTRGMPVMRDTEA